MRAGRGEGRKGGEKVKVNEREREMIEVKAEAK